MTSRTTAPQTPPDQAGAFIMTEEGVARLFTTYLADGPFSEHYEPAESPTANILHDDVPCEPVHPLAFASRSRGVRMTIPMRQRSIGSWSASTS